MSRLKISLNILPFLMAGLFLFNMIDAADHPVQNDGPYVMYKNGKIYANYIFEDNGTKTVKTDSAELFDKNRLILNVATNTPGKTFSVKLKNRFQNEKSDFKRVRKQLVISDIEGSFGAFRKLLKAATVIDDNFNWTFGEGHLVLTGDFFDRGDHVTEVLWLIYSLEEKARAAGGYVHFILGNHEIMNLNGDLRYVHPKYFQNAETLNQDYLSLYNDQSELGRWLRTKNVIQKIGNVLYIHGGISSIVNGMEIPASGINDLVKPYYGDTTYNYPNMAIEILYSELGPFWYRGYYSGQVRASQQQIDSTLNLYKANYIATGHTIAADTISTWYDKKLFNTDVPHYKGFSEALYIENNKFYRLKASGEKFLIAG